MFIIIEKDIEIKPGTEETTTATINVYCPFCNKFTNGEYAQLGVIYKIFGKFDVALSYHEKALLIVQKKGDRQNEGTTLSNISQIHDARGDYETALRYLEQSLEIRREIGDRKGEGTTTARQK